MWRLLLLLTAAIPAAAKDCVSFVSDDDQEGMHIPPNRARALQRLDVVGNEKTCPGCSFRVLDGSERYAAYVQESDKGKWLVLAATDPDVATDVAFTITGFDPTTGDIQCSQSVTARIQDTRPPQPCTKEIPVIYAGEDPDNTKIQILTYEHAYYERSHPAAVFHAIDKDYPTANLECSAWDEPRQISLGSEITTTKSAKMNSDGYISIDVVLKCPFAEPSSIKPCMNCHVQSTKKQQLFVIIEDRNIKMDKNVQKDITIMAMSGVVPKETILGNVWSDDSNQRIGNISPRNQDAKFKFDFQHCKACVGLVSVHSTTGQITTTSEIYKPFTLNDIEMSPIASPTPLISSATIVVEIEKVPSKEELLKSALGIQINVNHQSEFLQLIGRALTASQCPAADCSVSLLKVKPLSGSLDFPERLSPAGLECLVGEETEMATEVWVFARDSAGPLPRAALSLAIARASDHWARFNIVQPISRCLHEAPTGCTQMLGISQQLYAAAADTNTIGLVGPDLVLTATPVCPKSKEPTTCEGDSCPNGGVCYDKPTGYVCGDCPAMHGPRCEGLSRSFGGSGFLATQTHLDGACSFFTMRFSFAPREVHGDKPQTLLYWGPISKGGSREFLHVCLSVHRRTFWKITLRFFYNDSELKEVSVIASKRDGFNTLWILKSESKMSLALEACSITSIEERCSESVGVAPQFQLNLQNPELLFVGGAPREAGKVHEDLNLDKAQSFAGCLRDLRIEGKTVDLWSAVASEGVIGRGCSLAGGACASDPPYCGDGGECVETRLGHPRCFCALGFAGDRCQDDILVKGNLDKYWRTVEPANGFVIDRSHFDESPVAALEWLHLEQSPGTILTAESGPSKLTIQSDKDGTGAEIQQGSQGQLGARLRIPQSQVGRLGSRRLQLSEAQVRLSASGRTAAASFFALNSLQPSEIRFGGSPSSFSGRNCFVWASASFPYTRGIEGCVGGLRSDGEAKMGRSGCEVLDTGWQVWGCPEGCPEGQVCRKRGTEFYCGCASGSSSVVRGGRFEGCALGGVAAVLGGQGIWSWLLPLLICLFILLLLLLLLCLMCFCMRRKRRKAAIDAKESNLVPVSALGKRDSRAGGQKDNVSFDLQPIRVKEPKSVNIFPNGGKIKFNNRSDSQDNIRRYDSEGARDSVATDFSGISDLTEPRSDYLDAQLRELIYPQLPGYAPRHANA